MELYSCHFCTVVEVQSDNFDFNSTSFQNRLHISLRFFSITLPLMVTRTMSSPIRASR
jgi:hypothetical protein